MLGISELRSLRKGEEISLTIIKVLDREAWADWTQGKRNPSGARQFCWVDETEMRLRGGKENKIRMTGHLPEESSAEKEVRQLTQVLPWLTPTCARSQKHTLCKAQQKSQFPKDNDEGADYSAAKKLNNLKKMFKRKPVPHVKMKDVYRERD